MSLATIDEALKRIRRGEMVLVVDDEDRENEGDLTMAACWVTPDAINFMLRWARGLVCMPCDSGRLDELDMWPMVPSDRAGNDTAFTVSIDHVTAGSGIGAGDRATTIRRILDPGARPSRLPAARARVPAARPPGWRARAARATPRPRSTSPAWPGSPRSPPSARCSATTVRRRASRTSSASPRTIASRWWRSTRWWSIASPTTTPPPTAWWRRSSCSRLGPLGPAGSPGPRAGRGPAADRVSHRARLTLDPSLEAVGARRDPHVGAGPGRGRVLSAAATTTATGVADDRRRHPSRRRALADLRGQLSPDRGVRRVPRVTRAATADDDLVPVRRGRSVPARHVRPRLRGDAGVLQRAPVPHRGGRLRGRGAHLPAAQRAARRTDRGPGLGSAVLRHLVRHHAGARALAVGRPDPGRDDRPQPHRRRRPLRRRGHRVRRRLPAVQARPAGARGRRLRRRPGIARPLPGQRAADPARPERPRRSTTRTARESAGIARCSSSRRRCCRCGTPRTDRRSWIRPIRTSTS